MASLVSHRVKYFQFDSASTSVRLEIWKTTYKENQASQINQHAFFAAAELSADESTDHVSHTYLLKVSQNAGKSVYTVYMVLFGNSFRRSLSSEIFGLSWRSSCGPSGFFLTCLLCYLKLSPQKPGGGNK